MKRRYKYFEEDKMQYNNFQLRYVKSYEVDSQQCKSSPLGYLASTKTLPKSNVSSLMTGYCCCPVQTVHTIIFLNVTPL